MKQRDIGTLATELRRQRHTLYKEVVDTEVDLQFIAEEREAELEERAQEERSARLFSRLDLRGKREIELIDEALQRIDAGTYGQCTECGRPIAAARLRAVPATPFCIACARAREAAAPPREEGEEAVPRAGVLPPDINLLSDRELASSVRDLIRDDGRIDMDELRLVCRHGVVYLDGALPSAGEHQVLLKLLTDVVGFPEVVDHVQIKEILWARADRDRPLVEPEVPSRFVEPPNTEDIVENLEDGTEYVAPAEPTSEEE